MNNKIIKNLKIKNYNRHKFLKFNLSKSVFSGAKFNQCNFWDFEVD